MDLNEQTTVCNTSLGSFNLAVMLVFTLMKAGSLIGLMFGGDIV